MNFLKKNHFTSKAQAVVEFAIALPILLLIVYGLIETGRLLFIYSSVNNASRQAVRYGSTTGDGPNGVPRFEECAEIRAAAQSADFLNAFDDNDIVITYDTGDATPITGNTYDTCDGSGISGGSTTIDKIAENPGMRITVTIDADFNALMPNIVPFLSRTFTAISSRTLLQSVEVLPDLEDSETFITSDDPDASEIGEKVTVTVLVTGPTLIPTGSVIVTADDGTTCSIDDLLSDGTGSCEMTFTTAGSKKITASYSGDSEYNSSKSAEELHDVKKAATTTKILAHTPEPSQVDEYVSVTVTVTGGLTPPTGTIDVTGADENCTITLVSTDNGTGSCNVRFTSAGKNKTIKATYSGDAEHSTSEGTAFHNVIQDKETVTYITSDNPDSSQVGQSVNVSVTVAGITTPTGNVSITTNDGKTCTITLSGGSGSCSITFTTVGAKTIFATYGGDADHDGSSDSEPHAVDLPPTTTIITAHTPDPSNVGGSVAVTVTVTGGASTPTGTVDITGAGTNCTITLASGTGSCNVTFNSSGAKTLSATYNGDGTHATSSGTASHTVTSIAPVTGCDSTNITTTSLQQIGNTMTMSITNNLTSALAIGDMTVRWNNDKGHLTGSDKTLILQDVSIAGSVFWNGPHPGDMAIIVPATTTYVPANATSLFVFTFDKSYDKTDGTERVTLTFSNPGCDTFSIEQN